MSDEAFDASLDLLRRLDPKNVSKNLINLCRAAPELAEDLLSSVDQPLQHRTCEKTGKSYLICDYNRDGDSYRSPWSNQYYPQLTGEDAELAPRPLNELRELEVFANDSFDIYRDLYYEGGISSVYLWNPSEDEEADPNDISDGFAGAILLKKESDVSSSVWDSIHVIHVVKTPNPEIYSYTLVSTIILAMSEGEDEGDDGIDLSLSGSLTRQVEKKFPAKDYVGHITNIGTLVEDLESKLRNMIQEVYFGKTRDVVGDLRTINKLSILSGDKQAHSDVIKGIQGL